MRILSALTVACLPGGLASAGDPRDEVVTRHTASVDALQSLTCRVRVRDAYHETSKAAEFAGEYARFGDRVKCVTKSADATDVYVAQGDVAKMFLTRTLAGGRKAYSGTVAPVTRKQFSPCDPWCGGMLRLSLPNTIDYHPLAELVARAKSATLAADEPVAGVPCARLTLTFDCAPNVCKDKWVVDVWLSRSHGLLVKKCRYDAPLLNGKRQIREDEVTEFTATPSGAWFPKAVRYAARVDQTPSMTREVAFDAVATPPSVPGGAFAIRYHNPTPVTDITRETRYEVDESGTRLSPEKPLGVPSGSGKGAAPAPPPEPRTDTEREPRNVAHWVVIGASLALILGAVVYKKRRRDGVAG